MNPATLALIAVPRTRALRELYLSTFRQDGKDTLTRLWDRLDGTYQNVPWRQRLGHSLWACPRS